MNNLNDEEDMLIENVERIEITENTEGIDGERSRILDEIAMTDYKIIKAVRLKLYELVEEFYPGITDWYNEKIERLREIESLYPESGPEIEEENGEG